MPKVCTSINQSLDKYINKPLKDKLRNEYNKYIIENFNNKNTYDHLIVWINNVWYSEFVTIETIINSFVIMGNA